MAKITFYVLEESNAQQAHFYACRLIERLHSQHPSVYIQAASKEAAERFDTLLWTYRDDSFLPHMVYSLTGENAAPILIGYPGLNYQASNETLLINLSNEFISIDSLMRNYQNAIEIVFSDPVVQQFARERFKQYRQQGHELNTYKIKATEL